VQTCEKQTKNEIKDSQVYF